MVDNISVAADPDEILSEKVRILGFARLVLGQEIYDGGEDENGNERPDWQGQALQPLENTIGRTKIAVVTPNGAGKSSGVVAVAALWWVTAHERGKVVITTKDGRQLSEQIYPALTKHRDKFENWQWITSPHIKITTPKGGTISAFTTDDPGRAEGWHKEDDINGPLLIIVDEAKSVPEPIFQALDRCTYNAIIYTSSPGAKQGRFWDAFTKSAADFVTVKAGLKDCPHVPREKIEDVIRTYGPDHPFTKSTNDGEFMDQEDGDQYVVNAAALEAIMVNPPRHKRGIRLGFCDFGGAQSEHVFAYRDGNKIEIRDAWLEPNTEAAANRFMRNFRECGLKENEIWGDASDAKIARILADSGWQINRKNFGDKAGAEEVYTGWGAEAWWEMGVAIDKGEVILPYDKKLQSQLTTRKKVIGSRGRLGVEEKYEMAKSPRNLPSPDRGDAVCGAWNVRDFSMLNGKEPFSVTGWRDHLYTEQGADVAEEMGACAGL
jgi:hypothetical protein